MAKLLSNKIKKVPSNLADPNRFEFISLENTEPDLGVPLVDNQVLISNLSGVREWTSNLNIESINVDGLFVNFETELVGNTIISGSASFLGDVTVQNPIVGQVDDISNHTTNDLTEGNINLYFNNERAVNAIETANTISIKELEVATISYPDSDGTPGQVITTDGNKTLTFQDPIANGGITDQILVKSSSHDFDTEWTSVPTVRGLQLDTADPADDATGRIVWNSGDEVPQFISNGTKVDLGLELLARCRNVTGNTIPKGTAVCIVGASANRISIAPSDRTQLGSACRTLGLTLEEIPTDEFGKVSTFGLVSGINTNDFEPGDELFVGETPGTLTTVEPDAPTRRLTVGYVVTKNAEQGQIFVTLRRSVKVDEIDDVQITSISDGDILRYDVQNTRWENTQLDTDGVDEGNTNLYFTETRVRNSLSASGDLTYNPANGQFSVTTYKTADFIDDFNSKSTDELSEGNTNLYYTDQRAVDAIESESIINLNSLNVSNTSTFDQAVFSNTVLFDGEVTLQDNVTFTGNNVTANELTVLNPIDGQVDDISNHTTNDLAEGNTNLYFTEERVRNSLSANGDLNYDLQTGEFSVTTYKSTDFDDDFAAKNTDDLDEGNTNLYFTESRVRNSLSASGDLAYNPSNGNFSVTTYKVTDFNVDFASKNTDELDEGNTNLYFTTSRIDDHLSGANSVQYNAGVISLPQSVDISANVEFNNILLSGTVTLGKDPVSANSAATKRYVDEVAQGLQARTAAQVLVDTNLSATLDPDGFANNHATLTSTSNGAFPTTDGIDSDDLNVVGIRILLVAQTDAEQNGLWVVLQAGDTNNPWILRRCKDCRTSQQVPGSFVFVEIGNTFGGTGWVLIVENPSTFEIDVDPIEVVQFSGAGTFVAGTGLTLDGNEFNVNANLSHVTTVGTLVGGSWQANVIGSVYGGTGVNNGGRTITVNAGNVAFTAAGGGSAVTVPASGTLATVANIAERIKKETTTVATTSAVNIDTFDKNVTRAIKYIINVDQGTDFRTSEILVSHDRQSNSVLTEYAIVSSSIGMASFSTNISGDNVRLRITMAASTSANVQFTKILL